MEIQFHPNSNQQLIISVLNNVTRDIDFLDLRRILITIHCGRNSFSNLVGALSTRTNIGISPPNEVFDYFMDSYAWRSKLENDIANLEFIGLISVASYLNNTRPMGEIKLTAEGKRVAENMKQGRRLILRPKPELQTTVFIACAFGYDEIDRLYHEILVPACSALNYDPVRVDMSEPTKTITDAIMKGISESSCVIADLTYARPSVYFEVGYAHGLGIPILLTSRKDHYHGIDDKARIHFDLEQYKISFWSIGAHGKISWNKGMNPKERLAALIPKLKNPSKSKAG